jgi:hypothetical protein
MDRALLDALRPGETLIAPMPALRIDHDDLARPTEIERGGRLRVTARACGEQCIDHGTGQQRACVMGHAESTEIEIFNGRAW